MAATKRSTPKKTSARTRKAPAVHWLLRYHVTLWIIVIAVTTLTAVVVLRLPEQDSAVKPVGRNHQVNAKGHPGSFEPPRPEPKAQESHPRLYEEEIETFETRIKELDLALIQTLVVYGYDPVGVEHGDVEIRQTSGHDYHFQRIELAVPRDVRGFLASLQKNIDLLVQGGEMRHDAKAGRVILSVDGLQTHALVFTGREAPGKAPAVIPGGEARMVIVVDDLGRSLREGTRLSELDYPVTFSVMPHEPHSREVAELAARRGNELILHLPMQPESYPEANPGPGALFVGMTPDVITETMTRDLARVPGVNGVNNHMGSRFTRDEKGMAAVMRVLKERDLFFLDSMTTTRSCGKKMTARHHVPYLRRHVFLDNVRDEKAIVYQLRKAQTLAMKKGVCIAICHPYPESLDALEAWARVRDRRVRLVRLGDLLP